MVAVAALVASVVVFLPASRASANPQPPTVWSWYVETTNPTSVQTQGCNQANFDNSVGRDSEVILDFGGQNSQGTQQKTINGWWLTNATVVNLAEYYVYGYAVCSPAHTVYLAIGTNNSISANATNGWTFAGVVDQVHSYAAGTGGHVVLRGANDIETWGYAYPNNARLWESGFAAYPNKYYYVNYGGADGCPLNAIGPCTGFGGWTQSDYYFLSWGATPARVIPEIFYSVNAPQWHGISMAGGPMYPDGPGDEYDLDASTFTSAQAWAALNAYFPYMTYSMEVHALS